MRRTAKFGAGMPEVCRLGLATRGGSGLLPDDVEYAVARGINYLNWCGHPDGLSRAIRGLGAARPGVVVAVQLQAREADEAAREFDSILAELGTDYLDIATFYYVESSEEWDEIGGPGGVWEFLDEQKRRGRLRLIGLTTHQRPLAVEWAGTGRLDMLMVRYNAAHRGAEEDVFPAASRIRLPVVTFTGLRWGALPKPAPGDPPGAPLAAAAYYRFCLANENVAVALAAAKNRPELDHALTLLDDWRAPPADEMTALRDHGDRVRRHAGQFW